MNFEKINKIFEIVEEKVRLDKSWVWIEPNVLDGFNRLKDEIEEVKTEYLEKKQVFLEDELWDIYFTIFRITELLHQEWAINKNNILNRVETKYFDRVYGIEKWIKWADTKKHQKETLINEQNKLDEIKWV